MNTANQSTAAATPAAQTQDQDQLPRGIRDVVAAFEALCTYNTLRRDADAADKSTPFHSVSEPPIAIDRYAARFIRYLSCSDHGVLMGVIFAARYCARAKLMPSRLTMHRLLLTGTLLGVKCHHDRFSSNKCYARIGGVALQELNALEVLMVHGMKFRMRIDDYHLRCVSDAAAIIHDAMQDDPERSLDDVVPTMSESSIRVLERAFYPVDEPVADIPDRVPTSVHAASKSTHLSSDDEDDCSWAADGLKTNPSFAVSPTHG